LFIPEVRTTGCKTRFFAEGNSLPDRENVPANEISVRSDE
jgi:hypothetical protein